MGAIDDYRQRRSERLAKRGIVPGRRGSRFPWGLLKKMGIEPGENWTPADAWKALSQKGVTAVSIYEKLKRREKV